MEKQNDYILDIPDDVNKEWLEQYKADLIYDAELCEDMSFHWEIIEAIKIVDGMIKEI